MKILAISDIHGRLKQLGELLTARRAAAVDKIVLLGDYVGYGSQSVATVRWLSLLKERLGEKLVLLRGNWEIMLYLALTGGSGDVVDADQAEEIMFRRHNAGISIKPFFKSKQAKDDFLEFFGQLENYYVPDEYGWYFAHAGIDVELAKKATTVDAIRIAAENTDEYEQLWLEDSELAPLGKLPFNVVGGHIPFCFLHGKEFPYVNGNYINIDFRASSNYGRLGCVVIDTNTGKKCYNAIPIDAKRYAIGQQRGYNKPKWMQTDEAELRRYLNRGRGQEYRTGGTSITAIGDGTNGSITMDEAIRIMTGGLRW